MICDFDKEYDFIIFNGSINEFYLFIKNTRDTVTNYIISYFY